MKKIISILILSALVGCESKVTKKEKREIQSYSIEQFYENENIFAGGFSPDETKIITSSNRTGVYNVFALPVDGSDPVQLTNSTTESIFAISYFPHDERILYSSDSGGNEINHIYVKNEDGSTTDLTPWSGVKSEFGGWARDQKSFYFISNKRDPRFFDLYEMKIEDYSIDMIYKNEDGLDVGEISDDKRYLVLIKFITTNDLEMYLYDREKGEMKHISEHEGEAIYYPQYFDRNGDYLYYTTDEGNEFSYLMRYNLSSGNTEKVYETNWDIWYAYESWNAKYRVMGINMDAKTESKITNMTDGADVEFPEFEGGSVSSIGISKSENLMWFTLSSSKAPSNIFTYNFETDEYLQLTNTLNPEINGDDLINGSIIRYSSYDGLEIPAVYYQPHQASTENKVPALVWVHGGPGGQSRLSYSASMQYLLNHGYAILAVNNRGSSGYGKTFFKMDDQKHGDVDLKDCVASKKFLESTGVIDMEKVGIIGGSYGGYMVMAALAFEPEAFDVGVNIYGVTNWIRTLRSTPDWWESFKEALYKEMGDPYSEDSVRLYNISPLFHTENVTKPLIVLQGANDPRVLQVESDEIVEGVRASGIPVEYVLFPDEGHGFIKKENEIEGYGKVKEFLDKYLK
jgi:dipeptidyl aminopeptidase/acylaminoacyl peptidase